MTKAIDFGSLSLDQLHAMSDAIDREIERKKKMQMKAVLTQVEELIDNANLSDQELIDLLRKRRTGKPARPKFFNPKDPNQVWSGRGKRPRWFQEALDEGIEQEEMLIEHQPEEA